MERRRSVQKKPRYNKQLLHRQRRNIIISVLAVIIVLLAGLWIFRDQVSREVRQLSPYPVRGVVITQDQGDLDFDSLDKQLTFVYLNATTGATYFDDKYNSNYERLKGTDLKVGFIHNYSFQTSPKKQLEFITRKLQSNTGQLPIVVRVSSYGKYQADDMNWKKYGPKLVEFIRLLANQYGQSVVIKTTNDVYQRLSPKYIKVSHFWLEDSNIKKYNSNIDFVEFDDDRNYKSNHNEIELPSSYYTGSKSKWKAMGY